ncbi:MAG: NAD(P)H-hydrate dehydratase [Deltaproteobacteria bacterium]|nr:NAD(P)H-hydrate dehydratase [Deltaproteobacteria bacterium]MBN2674150.1 NAD(P)H-hydrate dehydratase [Deltaproteobacteria bacterium]
MSEKWNEHIFMTREQIRAYDSIAMKELEIPGVVLMENAGVGASRIALDMLKGQKRVAVLAGPGNNGGDGFVIARHLINAGCDVRTYLATAPKAIKGDARINYDVLHKMDATIIPASTDKPKVLPDHLNCDLVIDALLGTGVNKPVEGYLSTIIDQLNEMNVPVLAIDVPSGLDADTGISWKTTVNADVTATFGHIKQGLLLYPGAFHAGRIQVVPIGVPASVSKKAGVQGHIVTEAEVRALFPSRKKDAHKGTMGHLAIVAGSLGKSGAAVMASKAAMRAGTGRVTIATTQNARATIEPRCLEVMVETVIEKPDAALTDKDVKKLASLIEGKTALALGPGLTTAPGISALSMRLLQMLEIPAVIDADGINILAKDPSGAGRIMAPMVFTPHPGEMARLTGKSTAQVQNDRIEIARQTAMWHKVTIVLKGAHTVIASPEGNILINPTGNEGMASGGMGDVLTGIIGSYLAQGMKPFDAAVAGTYIHGLLADRCVEKIGKSGLVATDLVAELPFLQKEWNL